MQRWFPLMVMLLGCASAEPAGDASAAGSGGAREPSTGGSSSGGDTSSAGDESTSGAGGSTGGSRPIESSGGSVAQGTGGDDVQGTGGDDAQGTGGDEAASGGTAGSSGSAGTPGCVGESAAWVSLAEDGAPSLREEPWLVPTDDGMVVFGGLVRGGTDPYIDDGAVYDACQDEWSPIASEGAPHAATAAITHRAAPTWTGKKLLVWGGADPDADPTLYQEGFPVFWAQAWDAATNTWSPMSREQEPLFRDDAARVWTGERLLVWGGAAQSGVMSWVNHDDGALYDPESDRWTPMSMQNAPSARYVRHYAWTGSKLVIWGGSHLDPGETFYPTYTPVSDGAVYDVASDGWSPIATEGSVLPGALPIVWAGTRAVVLARLDAFSEPGTVDFAGALYDPEANGWSPMSPPSLDLVDTLENPQEPPLWTGSKLVVFGVKVETGTGHPFVLVYDPDADTWDGDDLPNEPNYYAWQGAFVANGKVIVAGTGPGTLDDRGAEHASTLVGILDPETLTWETLPLLSNHSRPGIVVHPERLLTWGGSDVYTDLDAPNPCENVEPPQTCDPVTPMITDLLGTGMRIALP